MTYLDFSLDDFGRVSAEPGPSAGFVDPGFDATDAAIDCAMDIIVGRG